MTWAYYNEIDPFVASWLRELMKAGAIAPGDVDECSIEDVKGSDLDGYTQCHFFAGLGGWSLALRGLGIPDAFSVWTGSPPCQPWSEAGRRRASADDRHLWPEWFRLIRERRPPIIFAENVPETIPLRWFDQVSTDLESEDYAVGAAVLAACAVEAPQERERLWLVAYANGEPLERPAIARMERRPWPAEPELARVAHGIAEQRNIVRAIGNGLCIPQAQAFIETALDCIEFPPRARRLA